MKGKTHKNKAFRQGLALLLLLVLVFITVSVGYILSSKTPLPFLPSKAAELSDDEKEIKRLTSSLRKDMSMRVKESTLVVDAQRRKELLEKFLLSDPTAFYRVVYGLRFTTSNPELAPLTEQERELTGVVSHVHEDDFDNSKSRDSYLLKSPTATVRLFVLGTTDKLQTDTQVKVKGFILDNLMVADKADITVQKQASVEAEDMEKVRNKKVAVILFNFSNDPSTPWKKEDVKKWMESDNNSVRAFYQETTLGRVSVSTDVYGWFTISDKKNKCDNRFMIWSEHALSLAKKAGLDPNQYTHFMYAFPKANCYFSGLGEVPGDETWINGSMRGRDATSKDTHFVPIHELGHNLGSPHASSYRCTDSTGAPVSISNTCTHIEYGDIYDVMGGAVANQMNVGRKGKLRWMAAKNFLTVNTSGNYTIGPMETDQDGYEGIIIPRRVEVNDYVGENYYIERRKNTGVFDHFQKDDDVTDGVLIHLGRRFSDYSSATHLLDMHPGSQQIFHKALLVNEVFKDDSLGLVVKPIIIGKKNITLDIQISPSECLRAKPVVSISPATQSGYAGSQLFYHLSVKNNDRISCGNSTFTIGFSNPDGISQTIGADLFTRTLAPEEVWSQNLFVTSDSTLNPGSYEFTDTISHSGGEEFQSQVTATYEVLSP